MTEENNAALQQAMQLMLNAGDAKEAAHEAIEAAHDGDLASAKQKLAQAKETLNTAHNTQTKMLTSEAQGKKSGINPFNCSRPGPLDDCHYLRRSRR